MFRSHRLLMVAVGVLVIGSTATTWGRGFGGFHGGGGFRGGMGGGARFGSAGMGGMRPGGFSMGGMGMGGSRPGSLQMGGMGSRNSGMGGIGAGGFRPGGIGGTGFGSSEFGGARSGLGIGGPGSERFGRSGPGTSGRGNAGIGARPSQEELGRFLGLPSDGGMHALGGNGLGLARATGASPDAARRPFGRLPAADVALRGDAVRRGFDHRDFYSAAWYRRYPGAWFPARWAYADVWRAATWTSMLGWLGYGSAEPMYYDYGNNVVYEDNSVYVNGQSAGTADQYYEQAQTMAATGGQAQTTDDDDWLSLGVFAMSHEEQSKSTMVLQLAVNKQGVIRGNYTNTVANHNMTVRGSVDKKTQRAAWTIGDHVDNVVETGIYNLTKDEAPALVHFGKDRTEQWLLVRLKPNEAPAATNSAPK